MQLSSRHLRLASPYFERMLGGNLQESTPQSNDKHLISAEDWDADAILIIMNVIHGRTRSVPRAVDLETLAKIAVLVAYYKCHESMGIIVPLWVAELKLKLPQEYGRDLVLWCWFHGCFLKSICLKL
ncbi:hypothetical protein BX600DRAFT_385393 [Xylariales sp. PMI_506]|nr:hypothetical protein BX600DRAFT_385393 [Xylariales sp. PMI_506]